MAEKRVGTAMMYSVRRAIVSIAMRARFDRLHGVLDVSSASCSVVVSRLGDLRAPRSAKQDENLHGVKLVEPYVENGISSSSMIRISTLEKT